MSARGPASRLVYSTEQGRICPGCSQPVAACACGQPVAPKGDGVARVALDRKGRRGKDVTVVSGLVLAPLALAQLAKTLKTACGTGGTLKDGQIEIQGDHRETVTRALRQAGITVKG